MRQIKASEIKPGMEVQFDLEGWDVKGTVGTVDVRPHAVWIYTEKCCEMSLNLDAPVTVLAEPQPEEPAAFGARVVVNGTQAIHVSDRADGGVTWALLRLGGSTRRYSWDYLLNMGPVTVIDATPSWTVPEQATETTPDVPEQIEEWPEDDVPLRPYPWRDRDGGTWKWLTTTSVWECRDESGYYLQSEEHPYYGPWTRVPHA